LVKKQKILALPLAFKTFGFWEQKRGDLVGPPFFYQTAPNFGLTLKKPFPANPTFFLIRLERPPFVIGLNRKLLPSFKFSVVKI